MKYRTKLFLAVIGTAVVSSLCGYGVLFIEFKHHVLQDEEVKTITVSATTASLIDPELFKNLNTRADEATLAYTQAKQILAKVRNANRRNNIYIESPLDHKAQSQSARRDDLRRRCGRGSPQSPLCR